MTAAAVVCVAVLRTIGLVKLPEEINQSILIAVSFSLLGAGQGAANAGCPPNPRMLGRPFEDADDMELSANPAC